MVEIYSKVCCMHLNAKSLYKQISSTNKTFGNFLQECRKHPMLKRYQIPDCLTIITQRLTKYLTLIENMINNSRDDKTDCELLSQSLENLRIILNKVNEAVAFHQNMAEFKKVFDNIESKSFTKCFVKNEKEARQFSKLDLDLADNKKRRVLAINSQLTVKCTNVDYGGHKHNVGGGSSKKTYKDVTCLTMNDTIVFLTFNDKAKYTFMNESSALSCTHGILIRPSKIEQNAISNTSTITATSKSLTSTSVSTPAIQINSSTVSTTTTNSTVSNSSSVSPYIINLRTNQMLELSFPDEISKSQWLTLVHTHVTPFIDESPKDVAVVDQTPSQLDSLNKNTPFQNTQFSATNLHHQNSCSSTTSNSSLTSSSSVGSSASATMISIKNKSLLYQKLQHQNTYPPHTMSCSHNSAQHHLTSQSHSAIAQLPIPILPPSSSSSSSQRCQSNCSSIKTDASQSSLLMSNPIEPLNLTDSMVNSSVASPNTNSNSNNTNFTAANSESIANESSNSDMQLSPDLANILYSFNYLIEQSLCHGSLMRSASSAGETITRGNQEIQASIPKRAETFNGASAKDTQIATISINSDLIKSRVYTTTANQILENGDEDCSRRIMKNISNCSGKMNIMGNSNCSSSDAGVSHQSNGNSEESGDSGYQSRLCMDFNHDVDNAETCSCTFESGKSMKQLSDLIHLKRLFANDATPSISKTHFESIIKSILTDYVRVKNENEDLKKNMASKEKTIDYLKKTVDECKVS